MGKMEFSIVEHIGTLRPGDYALELNRVEWGNMRSKFDLRTWKQEGDKKIPCRGLTLNLDELKDLKRILNEMEGLRGE